MAKAKKTVSKKSNTLITEQNLLIVLVVVFLVCLGVLFMKDNRGVKLINPTTVEQTK
jgi:hypothetical protein